MVPFFYLGTINLLGALADFDLIFNNCWTFNGDTSPIGLQAKSCQAWLTKEVEKMPRTREEAIAMSMKKKAGRPSDAVRHFTCTF